MRPTPLQEVQKSFESRTKLVETLAEMVDRQQGDDSPEAVKSRLMRLSNRRLLRLYQVEQKVRERFGDRDKLVEHIVSARKTAGLTADAHFQSKLGSYSKARLLDLANMRLGKAKEKQTPEERLKKKRGRKTRERALSKLKT